MQGVHGAAQDLLFRPGGLVDHRRRGLAGVAAGQQLLLEHVGQAGAEEEDHGGLMGRQGGDGFFGGHRGASGHPGEDDRLAHPRQGVFRVQGRRRAAEGAHAGTDVVGNPQLVQGIKLLSDRAVQAGVAGVQADDLFDATENLDGFVTISNTLKTCAVNLSKMCNDLRLLSSGPRTGFGEINLPPMQNGSSIMPGKINPVIPEVVTQVAFHVIGNDTTITMAAEAGQMELNAFEPVVFYSLFSSITSMTGAVNTLVKNCILGITANEKRCEDLVSKSVGITTALCPYIGYQKAASIAKKSLKTGESVTSLVLKDELLTQKQLDDILDPYALTGPELPAEDDLAG